MRALALPVALFGLVAACRAPKVDRSSMGAAPTDAAATPAAPTHAATEVAVQSSWTMDAGVFRAVTPEERGAADRERTFALTLHRAIRASALPRADASFVDSPLSIASALALAYEGARGATRAEIGRALGVEGEEPDARVVAMAQLEPAVPAPAVPAPPFRLSRATAVWIAPDVALTSGFEGRIRSAPAARVFHGAHGGAAEASRALNAWIREQTGGHVAELLPAGALRDDTRLALADAVDLEARWLTPFPKERTAPRPFTALDGKVKSLPTMACEGNRGYASAADYEAIELPLEDLEHALLVVAPRSGRFDAVESGLSGDALAELRSRIRPEYIALRLPRFHVEAELRLRDALMSAGIHAAFSASADFGDMLQSPVVLDQVFHGASLTVDESGVRASAATVMTFPPPSLPPKPTIVTIDRPFLFFLRNVRSGAVLFSGRFTGT